MEKIELIKKYCEITKQQDQFGVVNKDRKGKLFVVTFSNKIIKHIAYQHREDKLYFNLIGEYVRLSYATCGYTKKCQIGLPQKKCVEYGTYSLNKCAVVFLEKLDVEGFKFELNYDEYLELTKTTK